MKKAAKMQLEIIKAILNGEKPKYFNFGEGKVAVSLNGIYGYIFKTDELIFGLDKMIDISDTCNRYYEEDFKNSIPVNPTRNFYKIHRYMVQQLETSASESNGFCVYANQKFVDMLSGCDFVCKNPTSLIFATTPIHGAVGLFMPIRPESVEGAPDEH